MSIKSAKDVFARSHQVSLAFGAIAVIVSIVIVSFAYSYSSKVLELRVPNAQLASRLNYAVNESTTLLKTWILLGDNTARRQRLTLWRETIPRLVNEIEQQITHIGDASNNKEHDQLQRVIAAIKTDLVKLEDVQWWIDDISSSDGNSPSRVMYDREVLPLFYNINSAIEGLMYDANYEPIESYELRVGVLNAHNRLSDGLRELSEVVRTGADAHIRAFQRETQLLDSELLRFQTIALEKGSSKQLLDWVLSNYRDYIRLAFVAIESRKASEDNLALTIYQQEALPIARDLQLMLDEMVAYENGMLIKGAEKLNRDLITFLFVIIASFIITFILSYLVSKTTAFHYVSSIEGLKLAAQKMTIGELQLVESRSDFKEMQELLVAFDQMQKAVSDRERKLNDQRIEIEQLMHIITHDMKPPIINITGHAGVISTKVDQIAWSNQDAAPTMEAVRRDIEESVGYINQSAGRIGELVKTILQYSKLAKVEINIEDCDVRELIEQIVDINSHRLKSADIRFEDAMPVLQCDKFAMKTILSTLIDNAIQYRDPDRDLVLRFGYTAADGCHILSVSDNGLGIQDEPEKGLYGLNIRTDGNSFNFGIGLAGARKLVSRLDGKIWHEANPDYGTTFYVDMPDVF